ncbi:MAG TPA: RagB/SusD family nutrient uptake outer membrane protein [Balneolales bacterium]|nr:RagB/SusD family nutrient uptake outer membrane protein [Balneolales bacterium]
MKIIKNHIIVIAGIVLSMSMIGCKSQFLNRPPQSSIVSGNFYKNADQLSKATAPLYNIPWFDYNGPTAFDIGDAAAGNMITSDQGYSQFVNLDVSNTNAFITKAWASLYSVVNDANTLLYNINNQASKSIAQKDINNAIAQARFMRAVAYFYLVRIFGAVPIITNTSQLIKQPEVPRNKVADVYQFIINDLQFAANNLPDTPTQPGRVTKWSAEGYLTRVYLFKAALDHSGQSENTADLKEAQKYGKDVCDNSGISLLPNFANLFRRQYNNNQESLFALQWVANEGWGSQNVTQAFLAAVPKITGVGDGWGGGTSASAFLLKLFSNNQTDSLRQKATYMFYGDHYPDILKKDGGYTYTGTYVVRSAVKKYVVGTPADNSGHVGFMSTDINTYMLRLAGVYLDYAEAILGNQNSTSNVEALRYYNAVRERAGLKPKSSITFWDIWNTRWKELAFEDKDWFSLVRLHYFKPQVAINYINNQNREENYTYDPTTKDTTFTMPTTPVKATASDFTFPYPEKDVLANSKLTQPPVSYDFKQQK